MSTWADIILNNPSADSAWAQIFDKLCDLGRSTASPNDLHHATVEPDRLLAESAWDLWYNYLPYTLRTSQALRDWWGDAATHGRAVLILDAVSLREMFVILQSAESRHITPTRVAVTGSEIPSDTNAFAQALGLSSRSSLAHRSAPSGFCFSADAPWTEVFEIPFEDAANGVPAVPNVVVWHAWLDNVLHQHERRPDQVERVASQTIQSDGFWKLIDRLRQGRRLVVTSDHGYALARDFPVTESDDAIVAALRDAFGASRCKAAIGPWSHHFMPPLVFTHNGQHVVIGQRKWRAPGGFPHLCHGGMSLLEVAVPFIEFPPR